MVLLMVVLGATVFADAIVQLASSDAHRHISFFIVDIIITLWVLLLFSGLAIAHFLARRRDENLRSESRAQEETMLDRRSKVVEMAKTQEACPNSDALPVL